jgi:flagellar hook-length control protein FliK
MDRESTSTANEITIDVSHSDPDTSESISSPQTVTGAGLKGVTLKTVAQTIHPDKSGIQAATTFQVEIDSDEPVVELKSVQKSILAGESGEASSTLSDIPTTSSDASFDYQVQPIRARAITQKAASVSSNLNLSEGSYLGPGTETTNPVTGAQDVQTRGVALPTSSVGTQETHVSFQPAAFTKEDPGQPDPKTDQTRLTNEKMHPVEKEYESNEILDFAPVVANSHKETAAVGPAEGRSPRPAHPHAVEVMQQVFRQLNGRLKSGPTSMRLQLTPEKLGTIEVEVVRGAQGVSVTFFAEQASTGKLLETQLSQLRQSLVDSGVQLSGLNIGQHSQTGQEGGSLHQHTNFVQHSPREAVRSEANTKEIPRAERVTGQTSEVDYLI